ncbi:MAG TPA: putative metal-binding motif-containing protein [Kofleriaceae bacterium]|nr:putative metal-binding motif-containing protein [Kofleriaceae bacterium]
MKWLGLLLLASACSESGAHFTLSAPDGPGTAASFKVILATPEQIPSIANQRVTPDSTATQTVPYYLQRTVAGASEEPIDKVDGLRIKLEANFAAMPETTFIPFVLLYDAQGAIVGVGTFHADGAGAGTPSPIIVMPDEIDKYVLDVEKVTQVDDKTPAGPAQVLAVDCYRDDQSTFTSGIVWRPASGGELRVLFPNDDSLDATARTLDLDCDGHEVSAETSGRDCDDTRGWFFSGAQETCDGYDTNCDGQQFSVQACAPAVGGNTICPNSTTGMGLALCDDRTGMTSDCQSDPSCLCAQGTSCAKCVLAYSGATSAGSIVPCQPGIGTVSTFGLCSTTEPCTVQVVAVRGGWKAEVALDPQGTSFGSKATGITGRFALKVKRPEGVGAEIPGQPGHSTGAVDFAITTTNGTTYLRGIDLYIGADSPVACNAGGPYSMQCSP